MNSSTLNAPSRTTTTALCIGLLAISGPTQARPTAKRSSRLEPSALPGTFATQPASSTSTSTADNRGWWRRFKDPHLDAWLELALRQNPDLATAQARIEESRARIDASRSALLPSVTWDSTAQMTAYEANRAGIGAGADSGASDPGMTMEEAPDVFFTASSILNVGLELDITGRNTLAWRAARKDLSATRLGREHQAETLVAQLVDTYHRLVAARLQLAIVSRQVETNEQLLKLAELRFTNGQSHAVDVLQQRQQLAASKAGVPRAQMQVDLMQNAMRVLTAAPPATEFVVAGDLPEPSTTPRVGTPAQLAHNRNDLRRAAEQLESAHLRHVVARRGLAPSLRISGQAGYQLTHIYDTESNVAWGVGATLSIPIYVGGRNHAQLRTTRAAQKIAAASYDALALQAVREVEDALVRERALADTHTAVENQLAAAQAAFEESQRRYASGQSDYTSVLVALAAAHQAEIAELTARLDRVSARVELHRSLGGAKPYADLPANQN